MKQIMVMLTCVVLATCLGNLGCARAARDTTGFALREESVLNAPFQDAWHAVKQVVIEQGYDLYTRDKRGTFVAYTPMKRMLWAQPRRTKFTIDLVEKAPEETAISIESIRQVYGVTLLTHPNWHDRKQTDPAPAQALLEGVRAKLAGGLETEGATGSVPETAEVAPAEADGVPAETVEAPVVEAPPVEAPVVEAPAVEAPPVEAPPVEAPAVEAPIVEAPPVEAPVDAVEVIEETPSAADDHAAAEAAPSVN